MTIYMGRKGNSQKFLLILVSALFSSLGICRAKPGESKTWIYRSVKDNLYNLQQKSFFKFTKVEISMLKMGVNVKAALTSLNTAFLLIQCISVTFQAALNLYAYSINHCLAVLCKFLGDFWAFSKEIFFLKGQIKFRKI